MLDNLLHQQVYGVDIDKKAIEFCWKHYHKGKERYKLVAVDQKYPFEDEFFDIVLCTEVIEHVMNIPFFLGEIKRVLKSEGIILLSTPNYNSLLLKMLESTILELIARKRGFTRKILHPNKYTEKRLKVCLEKYFSALEIRNISLGMVLFVKAKK
ncbi:MAG: class I SAM-dependent methyltransferase [bacterium]